MDILWISDSPHLPTGFGKASLEILKRLANNPSFNVDVLAVGADNQVCNRTFWPFRMLAHGEPVPNAAAIAQRIHDLRPDVVVTLTDLWTPSFMIDIVRSRSVPWIGYFPIDAGPLPTYFKPIAEHMARRITTSDSSARFFCQAYPDLNVEVIKLGVDPKIFNPGSPRRGRPTLPDGSPAFVVGCVARNQPRKNLPLLVEAFARFGKKHKDALLYLHTNPWDGEGWALRDLLVRQGIAERTIFTRALLENETVTDEDLADIYRAFDVFALPTMAEGFCIPVLEAMASGIPVVATNVGAVPELVAERGLLIPTVGHVSVPPHGLEFGLANKRTFLQLLDKLYEDSALRLECGQLGYEFAQTLTWDRCARHWAHLLEDISRESANREASVAPVMGSLPTEDEAISPPSPSPALLPSPSEPVSKNGSAASYQTVVRFASPSSPVQLVRYNHLVARDPSEPSLPPPPPPACTNKTLPVAWRSWIADATGYADEARCFVLPLSRRLSHLRLDAVDYVPERGSLLPAEQAIVQKLGHYKLPVPYVEVVNLPAQHFKRNEQASYRIGRTMFEMIPLPYGWLTECHAMDELWLPTRFCMDLFEGCGIPLDRLRLVPGSLDTNLFSPIPDAPERPTKSPEGRLRFLATMTFTKRKGWEALVEAYARTFTREDPVELVLRTFLPGMPLQNVIDQIEELLARLVRYYGLSLTHLPPIAVINEWSLSRQQMRDMYRSADVVVLASKGEGYGRPLLEALACGVPVITTGWSGPVDFVTSENGWLLDYHLAVAEEVDNPIYRGLLWAEPSVEHLRQCLREALDNPSLRLQKAKLAASSVSCYEQEVVADEIVQRLNEIELERALLPPSDSISASVEASKIPASESNEWTIPLANSSIVESRIAAYNDTERPWVMLTSPYERCGVREYGLRLQENGLGEHVQFLSCPDLFQTFQADADLLHLHYSSSFVNVEQFGRFPPTGRLTATVHDVRGFERISGAFDVIVVHNTHDYEHVMRLRRKPGAQVVSIPLGCPLSPTDRYIAPVRSVLSTDLTLGYHGFVHPHKGLKELITSFALLRGDYPNARLLLLASIDSYDDYYPKKYLDECFRHSDALGVTSGITLESRFMPMEEAVLRLYAEVDLVVLPYIGSDPTGSSASLRIALASGRPTLVTEQPCFRDVEDEVIKFKWSSSEALAELIDDVLKDPARQETVVHNALIRVRDETWSHVTQQYLQIFRQVAQQDRHPIPI